MYYEFRYNFQKNLKQIEQIEFPSSKYSTVAQNMLISEIYHQLNIKDCNLSNLI